MGTLRRPKTLFNGRQGAGKAALQVGQDLPNVAVGLGLPPGRLLLGPANQLGSPPTGFLDQPFGFPLGLLPELGGLPLGDEDDLALAGLGRGVPLGFGQHALGLGPGLLQDALPLLQDSFCLPHRPGHSNLELVDQVQYLGLIDQHLPDDRHSEGVYDGRFQFVDKLE